MSSQSGADEKSDSSELWSEGELSLFVPVLLSPASVRSDLVLGLRVTPDIAPGLWNQVQKIKENVKDVLFEEHYETLNLLNEIMNLT